MPWARFARFWALLGPLGRLLEALETPLGRSWSLVGASWTRLRPPWRRPKHHNDNMREKINFQTPLRSFPLAYGAPFWDPKSTKLGPQTDPKLRRFSRPKKLLFKSFLGTSWADLGHFGGHLGVHNRAPVSDFAVAGETSRF